MIGHFYRKQDDKNRILIPAKLRDKLGDMVYATVGLDKLVELRGENEFNIWRDKLMKLNPLSPKARKFARILLGRTIEIKIDKQGRMALTEDFLQGTTLTKEVAFVGMGDRVELWPKDGYDAFNNKFDSGEESIEDLAAELAEEGFSL